MTDSSQYGIGACLVQVVNGNEIPIAFISKTLTDVQQRWHTIDQECYAIFYAIYQLEYLLMGRLFILKCDHKNIDFLQKEGSKRVERWLIQLQQFQFLIQFIPGKLNLMADAFSRLCLTQISQGETTPLLGEGEAATSLDPLEIGFDSCAGHSSEGVYVVTLLKETSNHETNNEETKVNDRQPLRRLTSSPSSLLFPEGLDPNIVKKIERVHNDVVGHHGANTTENMLIKRGERWKHMRAHVRYFVATCDYCQRKPAIKPNAIGQCYTVSTKTPMLRVAIDILGDFPCDERNNMCIIAIIDQFSRFITLHAAPDKTAKTVVEFGLLPHAGIFGPPIQIVSDNGPEFVNAIINEFTHLQGIETLPITPYSHQENSLVERYHMDTLNHLRAFYYNDLNKVSWSIRLPFVQRTLNTVVRPAIGCSPCQIIFGGAINPDVGLLDSPPQDNNEPIVLSSYMQNLLSTQHNFVTNAQKRIEEHERKPIAKYVDPVVPDFAINSYVLVQPGQGPFQTKPKNKLEPQWRGPYIVKERNNNEYLVANMINSQTLRVHVSRLRQFVWDPQRITPFEVAMKDAHEFLVEEILDMRGNVRLKSSLEFLVRWQGYSADADSWEPYSNLRDVAVFHRYLHTHNLDHLIPKQHKVVPSSTSTDSSVPPS